MPRRKKSKAAKDQCSQRSSNSPLARAFDHCPLVLFSFLTDKEAVNVARALCIPHFLPNKLYVIHTEVSLAKLLQGVYPCTADKLKLDQKTDFDLLDLCPSTVKSVTVCILAWPDSLHLKVKQLPRSLTHLEVPQPVRWLVSDADWPPLLSSLTLIHGFAFASELPVLPSSLSVLRLVGTVPKLELPSSLQELDLFDSNFNSPLSHPTLQKVTFSYKFNHTISARDLPSLRELSVGGAFNHPLDDLPASLTELILSDSEQQTYDHALDHLPSSLKRLEINRPYNLPLKRLPSSLSSLCIASSTFDQPLDQLPESLTEMDLLVAWLFNQPLDQLPHRLQVLKISEAFNHPLDKLPPSLSYLEFCSFSHFNKSLNRLPLSLRTLILPDRFNQALDHLPPSFQTLQFSFGSVFNQPLDRLPDSLSCLRLGHNFNQPFSRLPRGLTHLQLGDGFNYPLFLYPVPVIGRMTRSRAASIISAPDDVTSYPSSLRVLHLGLLFNQPLYLPPSLTELVFDEEGRFSHPLPAAFCEQLVRLELPRGYRL